MNILNRHIPAVLWLTIFWPLLLFAQQERSLLVEQLEIQGNTKTKTHVIENYLSIREGQPVTREELAANRQRLRETNFFKELDLRIMPGSEKGRARVVLTVKERRWPYFQFKSGYNELDGWYISPLGLRFDNLLGRGNFLGWEFLIGDRIAGSRIEFVRPFLFGSEYDLHLQLFGHQREFLHFFSTQRFKQDVQDNGILIRLQGNSGLSKYFSAAFVAQNVIADTFLTRSEESGERFGLPEFLSLPADTQEIRRLVLAATIDTRDRVSYPTGGWWGSVAYDQSSKELGSFADYQRWTVDLRRYTRLWKQVVVALRIKGGTISESAPFYEKFYLGGPNSLRGYDDRSLTPAGYGANLSLGSAELRFPLSARLTDQRFTGVFFYDAGYAWNDPDRWQWQRLKAGLGFGVRLRLPIVGILRLDFAYPVPDYEFHLHVSLGHTF